VDSSGPGQDQVKVSCEYGIELPNSTKNGNFLSSQETVSFSQNCNESIKKYVYSLGNTTPVFVRKFKRR
jgi:hypothetical protein